MYVIHPHLVRMEALAQVCSQAATPVCVWMVTREETANNRVPRMPV